MIIEKELPSGVVEINGKAIKYYDDLGENLDKLTVSSFGEEWKSFHEFSERDLKRIGDSYFDIVPPEILGKDLIAVDFGCGSGRWTKYIHDKFGAIAAVDPSEAIFSASKLLQDTDNTFLYKASIDKLPFPDNYFDFGFSLGVLHHIPDTPKAMKDCVAKIKPGGYFLIYLYYKLDNRGWFFKLLFNASNLLRRGISKMPGKLKRFTCDVLAVFLYMPFVGFARLLRWLGVSSRIRSKIPLNIYEKASFYIIRNDSLDRFGTPLEQRFSRVEIQQMMENSGITQIRFSENLPYWHAIGKKA
jgi:SAM-dependent methyltransferase